LSAKDFDEAFGGKPSARITVGEQAPPSKEAKAGSGIYKPYGYLPAGNIGETCEVQRWLDATEVAEGTEFQYRFLMRVGFVGEEHLRLYLTDCMIVIEGQQLRELRKLLARRQVTFIQQYSRRVWPQEPPKGEPMVTRVEIMRPDQEVTAAKSRN
jgi:hypothetical protein